MGAWIPNLGKEERNKIIKNGIKKNISTWVLGDRSSKITWGVEATVPFLLTLKVRARPQFWRSDVLITYAFLQGQIEASPLFSWLWSSCNIGKHNFSFGCCSEIDWTQGTYLAGRINLWTTITVCSAIHTVRRQVSTFFNALLALPFGTHSQYIGIWTSNL